MAGASNEFARKRVIATACLLALVDAVALVNNFFGVGLTVRLFDNLYRNSRDRAAYSDDGGSSAYTEESSRAVPTPQGAQGARYPVPNGRYAGGRYWASERARASRRWRVIDHIPKGGATGRVVGGGVVGRSVRPTAEAYGI